MWRVLAPVIILVGLPYLAGILTVCAFLVGRPWVHREQPTREEPKRHAHPLRAWVVRAGHGVTKVPHSRRRSSYIAPEWTPHIRPPLE